MSAEHWSGPLVGATSTHGVGFGVLLVALGLAGRHTGTLSRRLANAIFTTH